jgi:hypothetical protein
VHEGDELVDRLADAFIGAQLTVELHRLARHQEGIAVRRVVSVARELLAERGESLLGDALGHEVEGGGTHHVLK